MDDNEDGNRILEVPGNGDPGGNESDAEEQEFDISLAASHSYMGDALQLVRGRRILEAGTCVRVCGLAQGGAVFPGETVPVLQPHASDAAFWRRALIEDKMFALLCPDENGAMLSGYGVLCDVYEASMAEDGTNLANSFSCKARAACRIKIKRSKDRPLRVSYYSRMRMIEVVVLPELTMESPLVSSRINSLDPLRGSKDRLVERRLRGMEAAVTPWPLFMFDMFDCKRMRRIIEDYFATINLADKLPGDLVSLSFYTASSLPLSPSDRLALLKTDAAAIRLAIETRHIRATQKSVLSCSSCSQEVSHRDHVLAMSSDGVHANYTNLGGYMHDIVTVSKATNLSLSGAPSSQFSWFPGYSWTIALCQRCTAHLGWRFDALKKNLRPQQFFGLCRNYVTPRAEIDAEVMTAAVLADDPDNFPPDERPQMFVVNEM